MEMWGVGMANYTEFKKSFCECCDEKRECELRWGLAKHVQDVADFIDWEAVINSRPVLEHGVTKHCDSVYEHPITNKVYFIEFKNVRWFWDDKTHKLKTIDSVKEKLTKKFRNSKSVYEKDTKVAFDYSYVLTYDMNKAPVGEYSLAELKRLLRNNYFSYLEEFMIYSYECESAFSRIICGEI